VRPHSVPVVFTAAGATRDTSGLSHRRSDLFKASSDSRLARNRWGSRVQGFKRPRGLTAHLPCIKRCAVVVIIKAGDPYLRSLLVMGARAVLALVMNKNNPRQDAVSRWARALVERRGYWRAVVAGAAKNARLCWAVLQRGKGFKMPA
jgi:hypothetical protein